MNTVEGRDNARPGRAGRALISRFLFAGNPVRNLLLCAKHLFVAAMVAEPDPRGLVRSGQMFARFNRALAFALGVTCWQPRKTRRNDVRVVAPRAA
jgi:hypothetical protein